MLSSVKAYVRNVLDFTQGSDASGAIDVVVVQQEDGTFHCTPFHVHFSKAAVCCGCVCEGRLSVAWHGAERSVTLGSCSVRMTRT